MLGVDLENVANMYTHPKILIRPFEVIIKEVNLNSVLVIFHCNLRKLKKELSALLPFIALTH